MNLMRQLLILIAILFLSACCSDLNKDRIKSEISKILQIGDSREKVELVLKNHGIIFGYDEYENLYYSNIRGENCAFDKVVVVDVYMDKSGRVSKIETSYAYTMP